MPGVTLRSYIKSILGRVEDAIYYNTNGRQYMRRFTYPHNPRMKNQQRNRLSSGAMSKPWRGLTPQRGAGLTDLLSGDLCQLNPACI